MPTFLQTGGSHRQRARTCDHASKQLQAHRRYRVAEWTHNSLDQFEDRLRAEQEAQNLEDLAEDAQAHSLLRRGVLKSTHSQNSDFGPDTMLRKSASAPQHQQHPEDVAHSRRPPSPLRHYDYGCISLKPRSTVGQHRDRIGETTRAKHRHTNCGFYFPGAHMKQGPYGFSVMDPVLLSPKPWDKSKSPSMRWGGDPSDIRPLASEEFGLRRDRSSNPVISPTVRATNGHARRAMRLFHCTDHRREQAVQEQARFEHGFFDGRWRDPLLDLPVTAARLPEAPPEQHSEWLRLPAEEMSLAQQLAADLLFALEDVSQRLSSGVAQLFAECDGGPHKHALEIHEFTRVLAKIGVVAGHEFGSEKAIEVMSIVDPAFDGRVNLPTLVRAVSAARVIRRHREKAADMLQKQRQVKLSHSYSDPIPVEVVKVEYPATSLLNFNRSFQKFMSQQRVLLEHHNEALPGPQ